MSSTDDLCEATLLTTADRIRERQISPVELLDAILDRIERLDECLHAYALVTHDLAHQQAKKAEAEISAGMYRGPLHGIPIGLKDMVYTKGIRTSCGSRILRDFEPDFDAAIVERLNAAGAVIVGKLNLTEFALYGYHPDFDHPRNPWNTDYYAGVSSSGSGVAVAASLCFAAIGTDAGGSIRYPSAACGIVGIKPTFGKVSRFGVHPLAHTLDHVGPMARTVRDAATVLQVLEGRDVRDPSTRNDPRSEYEVEFTRDVDSMRLGIDRSYSTTGTAPELSEALFRAAEQYERMGAAVVEVDMTGLDATCSSWVTTCGVDALTHHGQYFLDRRDDYGPVCRSVLEGASHADARDYARGEEARQATTALLNDTLTRVDALLLPACTSLPAPVNSFDPTAVFPADLMAPFFRHTAPLNYSGHPSVTMPNGFSPDGLPLSMQIVGRHGDEAQVVRVAAAYENATDWHKRRCSVS